MKSLPLATSDDVWIKKSECPSFEFFDPGEEALCLDSKNLDEIHLNILI